ncbi:hypothetical protein [Clostridium kluyveri]|uniref:hypothetical protein n=1 Tax=Clostridium kluyveri TaxID=1534 RepID=UPI0022457BBC|nr:hypothetical protein [Clostridium kluyveri]UZQ52270.1 hypothetical protein OP486_08970 [Clostridium kluyveri]
MNLQNSLKNQTTSLTEFNDSFNLYCNGVRDMEENICSVFSKISGITEEYLNLGVFLLFQKMDK